MSARSQIDIVLNAVDQFSSVLRNAKSSIGGLESVVKETEGRFSGFGEVAKTALGVSLRDIARDTSRALTDMAGESGEAFMDFESTLTKIVAATGLTGEEAYKLSATLGELAKQQSDLGFTGAEAAQALEALVKAGMSGSEAAEALRSSLSLAAIEGINTETAANLLVQTLTMFGLEAVDSAKALDFLSKAADAGIDTATGYASGLANCGAAAANMGLSLEESLATLVQLDQTYGSATESGTYLNAMFKDLVKKSDELGLSLYNADGSMRNLGDIVGQIKGKIQGFGEDQAAVNAYLSAFDVRAQRAVLGLINYDGSIAQTMTTMEEAGSIQDKVNMIMGTSAGQLEKLAAEQENATYGFGAMTAQMNVAWKTFSVGLGPLGQVAESLGPSMLQGAISGVTMALPDLIKGIAGVGSVAGATGGGTGSLLGKLATSLIGLGPAGLAIGAGIAGVTALYMAYQTNFMGIRDVIDGAVAWIQNALSGLGDWFGGLVNQINEFFGLTGTVGETVPGMPSQFVGAPPGMMESMEGLQEVVGEPPSTGLIRSFESLAAQLDRVRFSERAPSTIGAIPARGGIGGGRVEMNFNAPLVYVEGSADAGVVEHAVTVIREQVKSVVIEATSQEGTTKRLRMTESISPLTTPGVSPSPRGTVGGGAWRPI